MKTTNPFHGSDLEKIEEIYHIPKEEIVCFGANVNPLGFPKQVSDAISRKLSSLLERYPDREYRSLREAIGNYCGLSNEYILVGNGSTELLSLLIESRSIRHALQIGPSYSEYERELSLSGCSYSEYYLDQDTLFHPDIHDLIQAIKRENADFLILCNPNNPTASSFSTEELRVLLAACRKEGTFVMVDETYAEFSQAYALAMPLIPYFDNLMVIRGVSKFFAAPGLRLGYGACSNVEFLSYLRKVQNPWSVNSVAAFAGEVLFSDSSFIQKTKALISSERGRMIQRLSEIPELTVYPSDANFILVKINDPAHSAFSLFDCLIRQKLMIRDCTSFPGLRGEFFRFCIMLPDDNDRLLDAIIRFFH